MNYYKEVNILGIKIQNVTRRSIIKKIELFLKNKEDINIFPVNVDMLVKANKDSDFKNILNNNFLIPDGKPLIWASKWLKKTLLEKTAGSDVFFDICEMSCKQKVKLFLLGAAEGVGYKASQILRKKYPGLEIVGNYSPPFGFENDDLENNRIITLINSANPDILFLAFGAPKQEKWISIHKPKLNVPIAFAIGATLDFVAGLKRMPPQWIKKIGFAWFYRLCDEPQRLWKRYLIDDMQFFYFIFKQKFSK